LRQRVSVSGQELVGAPEQRPDAPNATLGAPYDDPTCLEVDVLDAKPRDFGNAQAIEVHKPEEGAVTSVFDHAEERPNVLPSWDRKRGGSGASANGMGMREGECAL
jgi:hypothetical protein